jgi:hypothetical protein
MALILTKIRIEIIIKGLILRKQLSKIDSYFYLFCQFLTKNN